MWFYLEIRDFDIVFVILITLTFRFWPNCSRYVFYDAAQNICFLLILMRNNKNWKIIYEAHQIKQTVFCVFPLNLHLFRDNQKEKKNNKKLFHCFFLHLDFLRSRFNTRPVFLNRVWFRYTTYNDSKTFFLQTKWSNKTWEIVISRVYF